MGEMANQVHLKMMVVEILDWSNNMLAHVCVCVCVDIERTYGSCMCYTLLYGQR